MKGTVVHINMHVITSDTAYQVINQAWATQLFVNAVNVEAIPEPATMLLFGAGILGLGGYGLRRTRRSR